MAYDCANFLAFALGILLEEELMAAGGGEAEKGAWYQVPTWDGSPLTWRSFRREMRWWVSSLDLAGTARYNLAARWLLRQTGIVRQRGEEFDPSELAYKPAESYEDPTSGETIEVTPADYLFGLNKLLSALESINGQSALDKRGELRAQFYTDLKRAPGERLSEFATRFRTLAADLKAEGVVIQEAELGWFFKDKLGLDPLRKQLLDTALQGREDYNVIEGEVLRLFKDLHLADPLQRRFERQGDRPKLTIRRLFQSTRPTSSSASSTTSRSPSMFSSNPSTRGPSSSPPSTRRAFVAETAQEADDWEVPPEEVLATVAEEEDGGEEQNLEAFIQSEAEVLATELHEAEESGVNPEALEELESSFEQAAEALVTMREAKTKLQELRKDRGFGKPGSQGGGRSNTGVPAARKASGKHPCFDCGMHGHWAGDKECSRPGAGIGRKGAGKSGGGKVRPVRIAEVLQADHVGSVETFGETPSSTLTSGDPVSSSSPPHEVHVLESGYLSLEQALEQSLQGSSHSTLLSSSGQVLAEDKHLVGALDSACNRTCSGPRWLEGYLKQVREGPTWIRSLVSHVEEAERFKFGNGGLAPSSKRWRLPMCIGGRVLLVWVSEVPVASLGLLLGRDFLDAVGAILDFSKRTLQCVNLFADSGRTLELRQMAAGHFMLELLPDSWPRLGPGRWRRIGLDGIVELQLTPRSWLDRKIAEGSICFGEITHEHLLLEGSVAAGESCLKWHESCTVCLLPSLVHSMTCDPVRLMVRGLLQLPDRLRAELSHQGLQDGPVDLCPTDGEPGVTTSGPSHSSAASDIPGGQHQGHRAVPLEPLHLARTRSKTMARSKLAHPVQLAVTLAVLAFSLPVGDLRGTVGLAGPIHGEYGCHESKASRPGLGDGALYGDQPHRTRSSSRSLWLEDGVCGRSSVGWVLGGSLSKGSVGPVEGGSLGGSEGQSRKGDGRDGSRDFGSPVAWSQGWLAYLAGRFGSFGLAFQSDAVSQRDSASTSSSNPTPCGDPEEQTGCEAIRCWSEDTGGSASSVHSVLMVSCELHEPAESTRASSTRRLSFPSGASSNGTSSAADDGGSGLPLPRHAEASVEDSGGGTSPLGSGWSLSHAVGTSSRRLRGASHGSHGRGLMDAKEVVKDDFKISGKVKPGIRQMISQAWDQHRRDQLAISVGAAEVNEIFLASWDYEMKNAMNETFALEVQLPSPFVTEIYTDTEPVAKAARRQGLLAGDSLTLSSGWDFRLEHHRKKGILKVKETKPYLVILAFPCGPWSQLQALNPAHDLQRMREEALILVQFAIEVAQLQLRGKRHYLMENPRGSLAWKLEVLQTFMLETDALTVTVDMCRFGLRALDGELHRKATQLVTSMQALVSAFLDKRCTGDHPHTPVMGESKVSSAAGHYTPEFAESVVQAALKQHDFETSMLVRADLSSFDVLEVEHEVLVTGEPGREDDEVSDASFEFSKEDDALVIPTAVKNAVYRLHVNTSHRSNHRLARALLIAGAPREAVLAAKRLKCAVCAERKLPRARPPASLPPPRDVGQQVHIDLVMLEDSLRNPYVVAHATDNVSRFQAAQVLGDKSTNSVIRFLTVHWLPLLGRPSTIVADQGREFVSAEFGDWCDAQSIYLYHIGVGAPWQNGICERSGATLKALVGATVQSHAISNFEEMEIALSEAVSAYNADVNEAGVAPIQLVTGRMPTPGGDVLNGFASRLAEHSLIEAKPTMAKLLAIRETSRLSMIRLHYSRGLRQAELARSRATTAENVPQPGDLVFFWRAQKYQSKKDIGAGSRRRLLLRRWHGPGLLVALEGKHGLELSANCFVSFRGQLAKCPLEHVRKASSLESIAAGSWEAAIDEVIQAAKKEAPELIADDVHEHDEPPVDQPDDPLQRALQPSEIVAALQPPASVVPSLIGRSSPPSLSMDAQHVDDAPSSAAPGTPVPSLILQASQAGTTSPAGASLSRTLERARALDELEAERGVKRQLEESSPAAGTKRQADENAALLTQHVALPAFEALVLTHGELQSLSERMDVHPLLRLQAQADLDRREGNVLSEPEHGTWDGRWAFLCERDWHLLRELGLQLPNGAASHDALSVQASRKEKIWSKMTPEEQKLWGDAAMSGWNVYVDNQAVKVLTLEESAKVRRDLARRKELDRILVPRFVCTDKHDGLRTATNPLPIKPSSRLVVPGFRDRTNLEGNLRRDAPTGSRLAQHILFCVAAFHNWWAIISSDVKSAFLKGDPYIDRELYICNSNSKTSPSLPLKAGQLCRVLKGVFGLADAPREWWKRLSRSMDEHGWTRTLVDGAMWCLWGKADDAAQSRGIRPLEGIIVAHVDDLLFTGSPTAEASLQAIGSELGFGSQDRNDFTWCGKRIRRASDGTVRLSMIEYHQNLQEIFLARHRKGNVNSPLDAHEHRQLRAVLGSLQWLVAQLRFDLAFGVSSLQGESPPTIGSILRANSLVREFKRTGDFELIFRPVDYRRAGIVAVSDAALGNVKVDGSSEGSAIEKVYSQACHFILLGDEALTQGRSGIFNVIDARSHRIPRVCRSSYGAETLAAEESFDMGQLARGFVATVLGKEMLGPKADLSMNSVPLTGVVDAKDVFDKSNSDTSFGTQKSLAFSVAWLRSVLRRPNTSLRWTATTNMFCDAGTKHMDLTHLRKILSSGTWSVSYSPEFQKQVAKGKAPRPSTASACAVFPGDRLKADDPLLPHLTHLSEKRGWHAMNGLGIQVAFNARSYRTPEPRFSPEELPLRSTFGRFSKDGQSFWHRLEGAVEFTKLSNQHQLIDMTVPILITLFHPRSSLSFLPTLEQEKKKDECQ